MPSKVFYSSNNSKILRLARNINHHPTFIMLVDKLFDRMSKQGNQMIHIKILLNEKLGTYFEVALKKHLVF